MEQPYSLYLHIPFCTHRCAYCDFNTYAGQEGLIPAYVEALCKEIEFVGRSIPRIQPKTAELGARLGAHTVFFGGGTPSLLSAKQFGAILGALQAHFIILENAEITMEANPGTVSSDDLRQIRGKGINRISFGVQSANTEELQMLERTHSFFDVIEAVKSARTAGFENLNLDLIYGLPEQSLATWQTTLKRTLDLHPEHISAYALTLEHGTPFGHWSARGLLPAPDPDLAAEMYEWASAVLASEGYIQYEISNWSKPNRECIHNLQYWRGLPYLGLGAGAHGYANGVRYSNVLRIKTYIERLKSLVPGGSQTTFPLTPVTVNQHPQSFKDEMAEFMLTGLRLTREGISAVLFYHRFEVELSEQYFKEINDLTRDGLLEWAGQNLRLTPRGRLLGNQVFMRFLI
jgi:oxygen-independent coproporphyrinogen III oxidase